MPYTLPGRTSMTKRRNTGWWFVSEVLTNSFMKLKRRRNPLRNWRLVCANVWIVPVNTINFIEVILHSMVITPQILPSTVRRTRRRRSPKMPSQDLRMAWSEWTQPWAWAMQTEPPLIVEIQRLPRPGVDCFHYNILMFFKCPSMSIPFCASCCCRTKITSSGLWSRCWRLLLGWNPSYARSRRITKMSQVQRHSPIVIWDVFTSLIDLTYAHSLGVHMALHLGLRDPWKSTSKSWMTNMTNCKSKLPRVKLPTLERSLAHSWLTHWCLGG